MHVNMTQPPHCSTWIIRALAQLKEGDVIEPPGSGKTFTKWAGLLVAPDMEACEWIKTNVGAEFFNEHVARILHASPERFYRKSN
jgi:hypothetical protein